MMRREQGGAYASEIRFVPTILGLPSAAVVPGRREEGRSSSSGKATTQASSAGLPRATMSVEEAAAYLGIGRSAAYEACRVGTLPVIRLGRRILVARAALDRILAGGPA
ncbi:MAG: Helix-turn-helix domain [Thermomicrobiales bacterium]|nr:Helix-turn-helix domain [Thermomicrobiales bacterium]